MCIRDRQYVIVHALDGYDEISLTGDAKIISNTSNKIVPPSYFGMNQINPTEIFGGDTVEEAANIFVKIISSEGSSAQTNVVLANSALAIQCFDNTKSISDCVAEAKASIESGNAKKALEKLIKESK